MGNQLWMKNSLWFGHRYQFCSFFSVPFSSKANFQVYVLWELCIILFCYPELRNKKKQNKTKKTLTKNFAKILGLSQNLKSLSDIFLLFCFFFKFKRIAFLKLGIMFSLSLQKLFYWDIQVTEFQDFNFYNVIECICK